MVLKNVFTRKKEKKGKKQSIREDTGEKVYVTLKRGAVEFVFHYSIIQILALFMYRLLLNDITKIDRYIPLQRGLVHTHWHSSGG